MNTLLRRCCCATGFSLVVVLGCSQAQNLPSVAHSPSPSKSQVDVNHQAVPASEAPAGRVRLVDGRIDRQQPTKQAAPVTVQNQRQSAPPMFTAIPPRAEGDIAELLKQVRTANPAGCAEAIYELGQQGPRALAAGPTLTVMLRDRDPFVRVHAARALWKITEDPRFALPTLVDALKFAPADARSVAVTSLGEMGTAAQEAVPAIRLALRKEQSPFRVQLASALWHMARNDRDAMETLTVSLRNPNAEMRWAAAQALAEIAPQNHAIISELTRRLQDVDDDVRVAAALALAEIRPTVDESSTILYATATKDPNPQVRQAASFALKQLKY